MDGEDRISGDEGDAEEMRKLVEMLKQGRSENVDLRRNFESLKTLHLQATQANKQLQARYNVLSEERVNVERQYQSLCESWRVELEEKQHQFEQARAQILGPRDLELIKVKVIEEIEQPYKNKCEAIAKEAESAQHNFVRQRRDFEELQASYKGLEVRSQTDVEALRSETMATISALKDKLAALGQPTAQLAKVEARNKVLEREKAGLAFDLSKLHEEVDELRRMKERANVDRDSVSLKVERKVKAIQAEEMELSGLVEGLTRKNRHLQKELAESQRSNEELYGQLMVLQNVKTTAESQLGSLRKQHTMELTSQEAQHTQAVRRLEERINLLRDEAHQKERQMAETHISHQEQVARLVEGYDGRLDAMEKEHRDKLREMKESNVELIARVEVLKDACSESEREKAEAERRGQLTTDLMQRDIEKGQAKVSELQQQASSSEGKLAEAKMELDKMKSEAVRMELNHGSVCRRKDELDNQVTRLEAEIKGLVEKKAELSKELEASKKAYEHERGAQLSHTEAQRQAFAVEKSALTKRYQASLKEQRREHEVAVKKVKRRLKELALDAAQLTDELAQLKFKAHEYEIGGGAYDGPLDSSAPRDMDRMGSMSHRPYSAPGKSNFLTGAHAAMSVSVGGGDWAVDTGLIGEMVALRQRQQEYLDVAGQ